MGAAPEGLKEARDAAAGDAIGAREAAARLAAARRVVVKVGSALLINGAGGVNADRFAALAAEAARLRTGGAQVTLVSSGSIALGRSRLGLPARGGRPLTLPEKQAAAAAGQALLMRAWEEALGPHGIAPAQVLLTRDDTELRRRWLNARATLETLLALGAAPVINENDTVATEEIRYGDNDRLAARAAQMLQADVLVLLSDVDGLYTADPRRDPGARRLEVVARLTAEIEGMAGGADSRGVGSGGMATKLMAARMAAAAGCATVIADGRRPRPLSALAEGAGATVIAAEASPAAAYKAWIAGGLAPHGAVVVDEGAAAALLAGRSLLPAGVRAVEGRFGKGDAVRVLDAAGRELGRGLSRYDSTDAAAIAGLRSDAIEAALGFSNGATLIHADDLALHR